MGAIDLREIGIDNTDNNYSEDFELFASEFLKLQGYEIIEGPSQGPDDGRDLIVSRDFGNGVERTYLVECKHYAHSKVKGGKTVTTSDVSFDKLTYRLKQHDCDSFMLFCSTGVNSALDRLLRGVPNSVVKNKVENNP